MHLKIGRNALKAFGSCSRPSQTSRPLVVGLKPDLPALQPGEQGLGLLLPVEKSDDSGMQQPDGAHRLARGVRDRDQPATDSAPFDGRQRYLVDLAVVALDDPGVAFESGVDLAVGGVHIAGHEVDREALAKLALDGD